jgi:tungstate transport system substrate-binding protein
VRAQAALLLIAIAAGACARAVEPRHFVLATTTSVGNAGLLDELLPAFERATGIEARVHLAGSGRALAMLERGEADVAISHAPDAEAAVLGRHPAWSYRKIMFNDFVIAGPSSDPAGVGGAASAAEAMRRIAGSPAVFVSRADRSGTHERERLLWRLAGASPPRDRLRESGAGMAATLRMADAQSAYTLSDRATHAQLADRLTLPVLFDGDPVLINTYAVITARAGPDDAAGADGRRFADWVADGEGRRVIDGFRIRGGAPAFHVWPAGRPRSRPGDMPR